jgi:PPP family 3-phenylpropionic acid transporter
VLVGILIQQIDIRAMFVVLVACLVVSALLAAFVPARTTVHVQRSMSGLRVVLRTRVLMTFVLAALIAWSASTMVNGFFSIYLVSLGTPAGLVGSAWALGAVVEVPLMIAFPLLAARFGVGRLVVIGAAFLLLRGIVVVLATDPLIVVGSFALHGAGYALLLVGGVTYVASSAPRGSAATAQGVLAGIVTGLAQAIGPGVAGVIAGATSIHSMFVVAAVGSAVGVLALAAAVASGRGPSAEVRAA